MTSRRDRRLRATALVATVLAGCASSPPSADAFEARLHDARRNASGAEGTVFEAAVVTALREPRIRDRLRACQRRDAASAAQSGYIDFLAPGAFQVELRPAPGFAHDCVTQALAAEHLPEPPRYPYAIPFRWPRGI
jgi:hypothetical protein